MQVKIRLLQSKWSNQQSDETTCKLGENYNLPSMHLTKGWYLQCIKNLNNSIGKATS